MSTSSSSSVDRSFASALRTLYTLTSNAADIQQWVDRRVEDRHVTSIEPMREYLRRIDCDISSLRVVHVAGTKGKGSTCAFVERMLRESGLRTGLYTSPHLRSETERFRVNGVAVSDDLFAEHFWKCYERLRVSCTAELGMPTWFRMMTLLGLDIFVAQRLDVAVVEVGVGGRADATTVVDPVVCGVSSLGFDHMNVLGNTLPEIAAEKAGIFKRAVPAFSCAQRDDAAATLTRVAGEKRTPLAVVTPRAAAASPPIGLGIGGAHQSVNAALAVALSAGFLARTGRRELLTPALASVAEFAVRGEPALAQLVVELSAAALPAAFVRGLERCRWPGRSHVVADGRVQWAIDGAHTVESMAVAVAWFATVARPGVARVLVFNCANTKQPEKLLGCIAQSGLEFELVLFTTYRTDRRDGYNRERGEVPWPADTPSSVDRTLPCLAFQEQLAACYRALRPGARVQCVPSVVDARDAVHQLGVAVDALTTGSLYVAGSMLEALQVETSDL